MSTNGVDEDTSNREDGATGGVLVAASTGVVVVGVSACISNADEPLGAPAPSPTGVVMLAADDWLPRNTASNCSGVTQVEPTQSSSVFTRPKFPTLAKKSVMPSEAETEPRHQGNFADLQKCVADSTTVGE